MLYWIHCTGIVYTHWTGAAKALLRSLCVIHSLHCTMHNPSSSAARGVLNSLYKAYHSCTAFTPHRCCRSCTPVTVLKRKARNEDNLSSEPAPWELAPHLRSAPYRAWGSHWRRKLLQPVLLPSPLATLPPSSLLPSLSSSYIFPSNPSSLSSPLQINSSLFSLHLSPFLFCPTFFSPSRTLPFITPSVFFLFSFSIPSLPPPFSYSPLSSPSLALLLTSFLSLPCSPLPFSLPHPAPHFSPAIM